MRTELTIFDVAFRPLSDQDDDEADGKGLADKNLDDEDGEDDEDDKDAVVENDEEEVLGDGTGEM